MGSAERDHWPLHARQWHLLGPPLRPVAEDVAMARAEIAAWPRGRPLRALILGVTPELATLPWPEDTSLVAVDRCEHMIAAVWPTRGLPARTSVIQADWRSLPVGDASIDIALGDGCFTVFRFPDEYRVLARVLRAALVDDGRVVMRFYAAPSAREDLAAVAEDLWSGRIHNFHAFKWRLAMAVQPSSEEGARLGRIWEAWRAICPDPAALVARIGWPAEVIATIDAYRDSPVSYSFPTLDEVRSVLAPWFTERGAAVPGYPFGERYPALVFGAR